MFLIKNYLTIKISKTNGKKDVINFVNNITTNRICQTNDHAIFYTSLLNQFGRFLCDMFVHVFTNDNDSILIETDTKYADDLVVRFKKFDIMDEFEINIDRSLSSFFCPYELFVNSEYQSLLRDKLPNYNDKINFFVQDPRKNKFGFRYICANEQFAFCDSLFEFSYQRYCIYNMVPNSASDMQVEKSIILEYDFEAMNAISFGKGCYLGQELMAKIKHRGQVRKGLVLVKNLPDVYKDGDVISKSVFADSVVSISSAISNQDLKSAKVLSSSNIDNFLTLCSGSKFMNNDILDVNLIDKLSGTKISLLLGRAGVEDEESAI